MSIPRLLRVLAPPRVFDFRASPAHAVHYPVIAIVIYLSTIFFLQHVMRSRPPLRLTRIAFVHNVVLCALSIAMLVGTLYELVRIGLNGGGFVDAIMCDRQHAAMTGRLGFWMYIFYVSKVRHCFWLFLGCFLVSCQSLPSLHQENLCVLDLF